MTESIPFWDDWRFWQIVVTGALAFLGFTVGTWVKHYYDLRLDRVRRDHENLVFAIAFRAELGTLIGDAKSRLAAIEPYRGKTAKIHAIAHFDLPAKVVYANNTHRLGDLGERVAQLVVYAHGHADHIRQIVASTLAYPSEAKLTPDYLNGLRRAFLNLTRDTEKAYNALDVFLGDSERFPILTDVPAEVDSAEADPAEPAELDAAPSP